MEEQLVTKPNAAQKKKGSPAHPRAEHSQFVIKLKDASKRKFFLELLGELDFVEVVKSPNGKNDKVPKEKFTPEQQEFIDGLKRALHEVELHQQGKIELPTLKEVLAEL